MKLNSIWVWLLARDTMQILVFWISVWLPLWAVFGLPLFSSTDWFLHDGTYLGKVRVLFQCLMVVYLLYIPLMGDSVRKAVVKRRKQQE